MDQEPSDLESLLLRLDDSAQGKEQVSLEDVLEAAGRRAFGPLLLLPGLITLAPVIGDIPGVPTLMGAVVILTSSQLLLRREHFWLPRWLLARRVSSAKLHRALGWLRRPTRYIDRLLRPRLNAFVNGVGVYLIALVSLAVGVVMPLLEVVPFSANGAGIVLSVFGLALVARDGLLALLGLLAAVATSAFLLYNLV